LLVTPETDGTSEPKMVCATTPTSMNGIATSMNSRTEPLTVFIRSFELYGVLRHVSCGFAAAHRSGEANGGVACGGGSAVITSLRPASGAAVDNRRHCALVSSTRCGCRLIAQRAAAWHA